MKGVLSVFINFLSDKQHNGNVNMPLLIITLIVLLAALWICIEISRKNKLYINNKQKNKDNA